MSVYHHQLWIGSDGCLVSQHEDMATPDKKPTTIDKPQFGILPTFDDTPDGLSLSSIDDLDLGATALTLLQDQLELELKKETMNTDKKMKVDTLYSPGRRVTQDTEHRQDGETSSSRSDRSQRSMSIGERQREALAEMFERKIERLRNDDFTHTGVALNSYTDAMQTVNYSSNQKQNGYHERQNGHKSSTDRKSRYTSLENSQFNTHEHFDDHFTRKNGQLQKFDKSTSHSHLDKVDYMGDQWSSRKRATRVEFSLPNRSQSVDRLNGLSDIHSSNDHCEDYLVHKKESQFPSKRENTSQKNGNSKDFEHKPTNSEYESYETQSHKKRDKADDCYTKHSSDTNTYYMTAESRISESPHERTNKLPSQGVSASTSSRSLRGYDTRDDRQKVMKPAEKHSYSSSSVNSPFTTFRTSPAGTMSQRIPAEGSSGTESVKTGGPSTREEIYRIQDLEDTVLSLKRVLNDREREIDELKVQQRSLQSELSQYRAVGKDDHTFKNCQHEKRIRELIMEKECLATEVEKMRELLAAEVRDAENKDAGHLDSFNPNSPTALLRKIGDLESHIEDLTEANETAVARCNHLEQQLMEYIPTSPSIIQLQQHNKELQQKVSELRKLRSEMGKTGVAGDLQYMESEVSSLREDLRKLRDKNHQLTEDNIKLTEYLRDLEMRFPGNALEATDESVAEKFRQERDAALREIAFLKDKFKHVESNKLQFEHIHKHEQYSSSNPYLKHSDYSENHRGMTEKAVSSQKYSSTPDLNTYNDAGIPGKYILYKRKKTNATKVPSNSKPSVKSTSRNHIRNKNQRAGEHNYGHPDLIDDVFDDYPSSPYTGKQSYHKQDVNLRTRQNNKETMDEYILYYKHQDDVELPVTERTLKRRDSLHSNSTDSLINELSRHLQLQSSSKETHSSPKESQDHEVSVVKPKEIGHFELMERSVSPKPIVTQHNKHEAAPIMQDQSSLIQGKAPFAPRNPSDINLGDVVKFCRQGGKISRGLVKYNGHLPGKNDVYLGVELEQEIGKHDGTYEGQRYFQCKNNRGVFVAFTKVVMAWNTGS